MKIYTTLFFAFLFVVNAASGQMSGVYTIGGTTPDFNSILEAQDSLRTNSASGPVQFQIRPGTYAGMVSFYNIDYGHNIEFRGETGNPKDVTITCDIITDCVDLTIKNITILPRVNTSRLYTLNGMEIYGRKIHLDSCDLIGPTLNPNYNNAISVVWYGKSSSFLTPQDGIDLTNLTFKNFDVGVSFSATSFWGSNRYFRHYLNLENSTFDSCEIAIHHAANMRDDVFIKNNLILNPEIGIKIDGKNSDVKNTYIHGNKIIGAKNVGIQCHNATTSLSFYEIMLDIRNNMISKDSTIASKLYRVSPPNSPYFNKVVEFINSNDIVFNHNSLYGGLFIDGVLRPSFYNNSIYTDNAVALIFEKQQSIGNFNNYYSKNSHWTVINNSIDTSNWVSVKQSISSFESGSISAEPFYYNRGDLHSYSPFLKNGGNNNFSTAKDIDGEVRQDNPDIGADEFKNSKLFPFAWFEHECNGDPKVIQFDNISVRPSSNFWDFGDGTTSSNFSPSHQFLPGSYICTLTVTNNWGTSVFTNNIDIVNIPVEVIKSSNDSLMISKNLGYYVWKKNGSIFASGKGLYAIKVKNGGIYSVTYLDSSGCSRTTDDFLLVGIHQNVASAFQIFPNPANNQVRLRLNNPLNGTLIIRNISGQLIYKQLITKENLDIDISDFPKSTYVVTYLNPAENKITHKKLVVQ